MHQNVIYQVDSFTDVPFKGNPAGVMIMKEPMAREQMQLIAREMNLSETTFSAYGILHRSVKFRFAGTRHWPRPI